MFFQENVDILQFRRIYRYSNWDIFGVNIIEGSTLFQDKLLWAYILVVVLFPLDYNSVFYSTSNNNSFTLRYYEMKWPGGEINKNWGALNWEPIREIVREFHSVCFRKYGQLHVESFKANMLHDQGFI